MLATMPTPAVSVLMPVYNAAPWLPAALASLLAQTFTDFELVAVDDGSTDASLAILRDARDARLRVLAGPHRGVVAAMRTALAQARAPLVARADADDVYAADRLQRQVEFLAHRPAVAAVGAAVRRLGQRLTNPAQSARIRWTALYRNPIANTTVMVRRAAALAVGGYPADHRLVDDYPFLSRLVDRFEAANLPEVLATVTVHPDSISAAHSAAAIAECDRVRRANLRRLVGDETAVCGLFFLLSGGRRPASLGPGDVAPLLDRARAAFAARYGDPAVEDPAFDRWVARELFEQALRHGHDAPDIALAMCWVASRLSPGLWRSPRTARSLLRHVVLPRLVRSR
jgi:glycosyltransferase involved in cell wall biosynthesis